MTKNEREMIIRGLSDAYYHIIENGRTEVLIQYIKIARKLARQLKKDNPQKYKRNKKKVKALTKKVLKDNDLILEALRQAKLKKVRAVQFHNTVQNLAKRIDERRMRKSQNCK